MPRIRTIKPEFWADEKLAPLAVIDRLVFLGLISLADDSGRVLDSTRAIDGFVFPSTKDSSRKSIERLAALGRIERGVTESGQRIIQIVNWTTHQRIDKPNFLAALPPIAERTTAPKPTKRSIVGLAEAAGAHSSNDPGTIGDDSTPHTNDQRPATNEPRTTTIGPDSEAEGKWPELFVNAWREAHGTSIDAAAIRERLREVVAEVGESEGLARWRSYLNMTELRFASASSFAQKHPAFGPNRDGTRPGFDRRARHLAADDGPTIVERF